VGTLKSRSRCELVGGVAAPHKSKVAVNVGKAAFKHSASLCPWERCMRNVANEGYGVAEAAQGFKGNGRKKVLG
jgi:hypothetical protein